MPYCTYLSQEEKRDFYNNLPTDRDKEKIDVMIADSVDLIRRMKIEYHFKKFFINYPLINSFVYHTELWKSLSFYNIMLLNVFKEWASKRFKDFKLHCMMDEIGKLHPNNVRGILKFANDRNILLINSSPIENDALAFKHIYKLKKDEKSITRVNRILSQYPAL